MTYAPRPARRAESLFADTFLPDEAVRIRKEARDFAETHLRSDAFRLNTTAERRDGFARDIFDQMAKAGLYAIPFPKDVGGRGLEFPVLASMMVIEEIAYFTPGIASALYDVPVLLVGQTLAHAPAHLRRRYLPALVRGEFVGAFATSEPQASTDLSPEAMQTVATKVAGGWKINGRKRWITNAVAADVVIVLCRSTENRQSLLLVETKSNGVVVSEPDLKMGNHAQLTSDMQFVDAFASDEHLIGAEGGGLRVALSSLMLGRIGIGAVGVAMGQAAFDIACQHMQVRKVFGQELARFQHWQFAFADHAIALESARSLCHKAALRFDRGESPETEAAMAKTAGSRLAVDLARDAMQVCGAYGFARLIGATDEPQLLESIYRDSKIGEIYEGANEIQKWIIARQIFGREITG